MKITRKVGNLTAALFAFGSVGADAAIVFTDNDGTLQFELTQAVIFPSLHWNNIGLTSGYTGSEIIDVNSFNYIGTTWSSVTSNGALVTNGSWTVLSGNIGPSVAFNTRFRQSEGDVVMPAGIYVTTTQYSDYNVSVENVFLGTWDGSDVAGVSDSIGIVPEPSSALFLGLGALGLVARRKKIA